MATIHTKKETLRLTVDSLGGMGDGIGRVRGKPCFVAHTAPGDEVEISVESENRRQLRGRLLRVLSPGKGRRESPCELAGYCGGCAWLHLKENWQLDARRETLVRALGGADVDILSPGPSLGYRRLARLHYQPGPPGNGRLGFAEAKGHRIVDLKTCPILAPALVAALEPLKKNLLVHVRRPLDVHLALGNNGVIAFLRTEEQLPQGFYQAARVLFGDFLGGVVLEVDGVRSVLFGQGYVEQEGLDKSLFRAPAGSFGQANGAVNQILLSTVRKWVDQLPRVNHCLELFAGAGNISMVLAPLVKKLVTVEFDDNACRAARENLSVSGAKNSDVKNSDALDGYLSLGNAADLVVLDPPRTGHRELAEAMSRRHHRNILYISCNPTTLDRDLRILHSKGYSLTRAVGFDMFPQTPHVEAAVLLEKIE